MKKVMVFGTFDVLHKGHLDLFNQARKFGDYLIVVVARDKNVLKIKGKLPRNNEKKRLDAIKNYADKWVLGFLKDRYKVIREFKPNIICLGYDQEANIKELKLLKIRLIRLKAHMPHKYKSSKLQIT